MSVSGLSGGYASAAQAQAQWDAIASIKSMSPFAATSGASQAGSVAGTLDAVLGAYSQLGAPGQSNLQAEIATRIQSAQQTTIDLFA